jgi:hypothetical protein
MNPIGNFNFNITGSINSFLQSQTKSATNYVGYIIGYLFNAILSYFGQHIFVLIGLILFIIGISIFKWLRYAILFIAIGILLMLFTSGVI